MPESASAQLRESLIRPASAGLAIVARAIEDSGIYQPHLLDRKSTVLVFGESLAIVRHRREHDLADGASIALIRWSLCCSVFHPYSLL